jgi:hypothetical protein
MSLEPSPEQMFELTRSSVHDGMPEMVLVDSLAGAGEKTWDVILNASLLLS